MAKLTRQEEREQRLAVERKRYAIGCAIFILIAIIIGVCQ